MLKAHGDRISAGDRLHATAIAPHFSFADVYYVALRAPHYYAKGYTSCEH